MIASLQHRSPEPNSTAPQPVIPTKAALPTLIVRPHHPPPRGGTSYPGKEHPPTPIRSPLASSTSRAHRRICAYGSLRCFASLSMTRREGMPFLWSSVLPFSWPSALPLASIPPPVVILNAEKDLFSFALGARSFAPLHDRAPTTSQPRTKQHRPSACHPDQGGATDPHRETTSSAAARRDLLPKQRTPADSHPLPTRVFDFPSAPKDLCLREPEMLRFAGMTRGEGDAVLVVLSAAFLVALSAAISLHSPPVVILSAAKDLFSFALGARSFAPRHDRAPTTSQPQTKQHRPPDCHPDQGGTASPYPRASARRRASYHHFARPSISTPLIAGPQHAPRLFLRNER